MSLKACMNAGGIWKTDKVAINASADLADKFEGGEVATGWNMFFGVCCVLDPH